MYRLIKCALRCFVKSLVFSASFQTTLLADVGVIDIASGEWPPYQSQDLRHYGYASRIVTEAFRTKGISVKYHFLPWARSFEMARRGDFPGTFLWGYNQERESDFYYSDSVVDVKYVFFYLEEDHFTWNTIQDLQGLRIGTVLSYSYGKEFDNARKLGQITAENVETEKANFLKLLTKRIDIVANDLEAGLHIIRSLSPEQAARISYHPRPLRATPHYVLFSRRHSEAKKYHRLFNEGLGKLKASGLLDQYEEESRLPYTSIRYPALEGELATRFADLAEILESAFQKTVNEFGLFELEPVPTGMTEARLLREVENNRKVDVMWSSTSEKKEEALIPVRVPLRKGLLGYRISLIHKSKQTSVNYIKELNDLRSVVIGQGIGWGDVTIYRSQSIKVEEANYLSLFRMVNSNRVDLFPRGINEVFIEYETYSSQFPNLAVEENLALFYPWPYYFFTSRDNPALADRLKAGLQTMISDGSFDEIFMKHHADAIKKARLHERRLIKLRNPLLPPLTPLNEPLLWYQPDIPANH